jgi:hypothetical protein
LQNDPNFIKNYYPGMSSDVIATANGNYQFAPLLPIGYVYSVSVASQPAGQVCTVANSSGGVVGTTLNPLNVSCLPVQ